ncbi:hypothetical protein LCL89_03595 [Halobacillus yeomjeoni]|uniref:hypothetical protein n=1 Tax=Halobacillus yeomjeoni TaxID=311194 RepID=UPI001CD4930D|nr:hypothetical protein [Halobacillus yeomjeoni]MCA0983129.1 hypothetical protein [Halobacillus yeomjeoni]
MKRIAAGVLFLLFCLIGIQSKITPTRMRSNVQLPNGSFYPGTDIEIEPGDLLFTPIGKSESKYVGHVGIVNGNLKVVHSIPAGLALDEVPAYFQKFRSITIFSPVESDVGRNTASFLDALYDAYPRAVYRVMTPLGFDWHEQYCTKIVWQAYYYGSGINLGSYSPHARAIHPELLKDRRYLKIKAKGL